MKQLTVAISVAAASVIMAMSAQAAEIYNKNSNKLDLYGKVDGLHYFSDESSNNGDHSYARLGIKGETQITEQLTGYGQWEYNIQANGTENNNKGDAWTRLAFAGLKFDNIGSFDYGRNYGVMYDVESWTDMLPEFGGSSYTKADNYMTGRANGVATYRNTDFFGLVDGLNFALQYQGANENQVTHEQKGTANGSDRNIKNANGDGFGISSTYDTGMGISFGAAYTNSDRTNQQTKFSTAKGNKAEAWTVGAKYDANNLYLATMYAETHNMTPYGNGLLSSNTIANKTQNFEITAQYQFDFGLRPAISFLMSKGKGLVGINGGDKDLVKFADIGATYYFNKNMSTYVDYKINLLDKNDSFYSNSNYGISTDDIVALGLVYQF
ncbi:TPA: porin OmpC [Escherichia coli]|nr:porin OmpC [Escherichia coli]